MSKSFFSIGADPEMFASKDGKIVSAEGLIGGSKEEPTPILENGFFMQEDNVMIEFNIPPTIDRQEFADSILKAKEYINMLMDVQGYGIVDNVTTHEFTKEEVTTPQARKFGCDRDFDAYTGMRKKKPCARTAFRSCGGHIHVGLPANEYNLNRKRRVVKALDITIGLPSVILDPDKVRRATYGQAGSFRIKGYGLEYRTPSNFWIKNEKSCFWVYDNVKEALELEPYIQRFDHLSSNIQFVINNSDASKAPELLEEINTIKNKIKVTV